MRIIADQAQVESNSPSCHRQTNTPTTNYPQSLPGKIMAPGDLPLLISLRRGLLGRNSRSLCRRPIITSLRGARRFGASLPFSDSAPTRRTTVGFRTSGTKLRRRDRRLGERPLTGAFFVHHALPGVSTDVIRQLVTVTAVSFSSPGGSAGRWAGGWRLSTVGGISPTAPS